MSSQFDVQILNNVVKLANTTTLDVLNQIKRLNYSDVKTATHIINQIVIVLNELYKLTGSDTSPHLQNVKEQLLQIKNQPDYVYKSLEGLEEYKLLEDLLKNNKTKQAVLKKLQGSTEDTIINLYSSAQDALKLESSFDTTYVQEVIQSSINNQILKPLLAYCHDYLVRTTSKLKHVSLLQRTIALKSKKHQNTENTTALAQPQTKSRLYQSTDDTTALKEPQAQSRLYFIAASHYIKLIAEANQASKVSSH